MSCEPFAHLPAGQLTLALGQTWLAQPAPTKKEENRTGEKPRSNLEIPKGLMKAGTNSYVEAPEEVLLSKAGMQMWNDVWLC